MTIRCSNTSLIPGKIVCSNYYGLGVPYEDIPSTGESGPALMYNDGSPGDELRFSILSFTVTSIDYLDELSAIETTGIGQVNYRVWVNNTQLVPDSTATMASSTTPSGSGSSVVTAVSSGQGFTATSGSGSSVATAVSYGEGLAPSLTPQGSGQTTVTTISYGEGFTAASGSGNTVTTATSYGQGPIADRQPDVVIYVNMPRYVVTTVIERITINA